MWGGGNPLNIIRIGGALEQFDIVLCNDLNGCISNLIVDYKGLYYSLTWNSDYAQNGTYDMTQNNTDSRFIYLHTGKRKDTEDDLLHHNWYQQKNTFDYGYGGGKLRPIIEFRE